jgi:hypothetical protein
VSILRMYIEVSFIGGGHWQTLSHNVVSSKPGIIGMRTRNISGDRHW